jgi:hypothetical protein
MATKKQWKPRKRDRRRRCPFRCDCICHDTLGSGHDHEGEPCPGKVLIPRKPPAPSQPTERAEDA